MEIKSKGFLTNLMFARFAGSVTDKGHYTLIQTPSNPGYHWGNYLLFDGPPQKGDLKKWTELFDKEFPYYKEPQHYIFAWESLRPTTNLAANFADEFIAAGFELDPAVVLTAPSLRQPPRIKAKIEIKKIISDQEWGQAIENQILCADPKHLNNYYRDFKLRQMDQYRKMSDSGKGFWFGAYLDNKLVGDLGIFFEKGIGRYQSVCTHPEYRRQGICGTLVYQSGLFAMKEFGLDQLVMEADPDYHAARIYESVGFQRNEVNQALSWWKSHC